MTAAKKFKENLEIINTRIENLTPLQMHRAMVNCDRLIPNFGKSWQEFRTWHFVSQNAHEFDPCTKEQMMAYIAHKMEMLRKNKYLLTA